MYSTLEKHSKSIDGLRAVAVVAVIINHFNESLLPSGFLGVDVFFVISGFVFTSSIFKKKEKNAIEYFTGFYKRRIKRLYPALLFCFSITAFAISFFDPNPAISIRTGLLSIPGFSNLYLFKNATDYWSQSAKLNPFTHTWSLGVEEQFYFIFPVVIFFTTGLLWNKLSLDRSKKILAVLSLISLLLYGLNVYVRPELAYYVIPFRFWEIGAGCLLYMILKSGGRVISGSFFQLYSILVLIISIFFLPKEYYPVSTTLIVFFTCLLIVVIKSREELRNVNSTGNILTTRAFLYTGKISYSLYLWHWVVIVIGKWTIGVNNSNSFFLLAVMIIMSLLSYNFIEKPLRHRSWRRSSGAKLTLGVFSGVWVLFLLSQSPILSTDSLYLGEPIQVSASENLKAINGKSKFSTIRLLGNSHSTHILPLISLIADKTNSRTIYNNHPNFVQIPFGDKKDVEKILEVVAPLNRGDLLILSSRFRYLYEQSYRDNTGTKWVDHTAEKKGKNYGLENWLEELDALLLETSKKGVNVILFLPGIEFDTVVPSERICRDEWFRTPDKNCYTTVSKDYLRNRFSSSFYSEIEKRALNREKFYVFDPMPIYCADDEEKCSRVVNGVIAFNDTNHLSKQGALLMLDYFIEFLQDNDIW
jgi:peptidoglycan/LPS O-acetylase OafA/YrhL